MKKEVIFFVNSMGGGGAERVIALLSNHLVDKGHKVFILTLVKCESLYELNSNVNCVNILDLPVCSFRNRLFRFFYWRFYRKFRSNYSEPPSKSTKIHRVRPYGKLSLAIILWIVMNYCLIWG